MRIARMWTEALLGLALLAEAGMAQAQATGAQEGLLVVYGRRAASREGDVDHREQIFFSLPADLRERVYLRLYDPETGGAGDFTYGGSADSETTFRLFGGAGAFTAATRPEPVAEGARAPRQTFVPVSGPGELLKQQSWRNERETDGRWVTLAAVRARQGEVVDERAYFRLDVQGSEGNDGNSYSLGVSLARDRARPPEGLEMFAYRPTVRWAAANPATWVRFTGPGAGALTVQSFDGANADLALVTDFADLGLRSSGQDFWTSDSAETGDRNLAVSLKGGFETPNDVTMAVFDAEGNPLPLQMPPLRAPDPARPRLQATARPLADCRSVAFDASGSVAGGPLSHLWTFGDGNSAQEPVIAYRYDAPGHYTARLEGVEAGTRPGRGAALELPVHVRDAPVAVPGPDIMVAPGEPVAFDGSGSRPSDSPITRYNWRFGDGAVAEGARASHAYATPGQYRAVLRVEDGVAHPCNFGIETRRVVVNFPPVAEAGTDQQAVVGQPVILSAGASYDIDGQLDSYVWEMGDGTVLDGETVTHTFTGSGSYSVMLRVTDDSGVVNGSAQDRMTVVVNAPPEPRFAIPDRPVAVSELAVLDGSASSDGDGQILSYIWDFGDGATGEGQVVNYAWTKPGAFDVTLTVIDDSGTASALQSVSQVVRVDAAPLAEAGPDQFVTASVVRFDGGGSTDSDGSVTRWDWDFGDGASASGQQVEHAYERPGSYEVALVVRDDSGAPLNLDRDTLRVVVNATPIADAGPPQVVAPGEEVVLSGRASLDPDGAIAGYDWRFPDGSEQQGARVAHVFDAPGLYRVGLTVSDGFPGGAAQDDSEVLITVNAAPVAVAGPDLLIAPGDSVLFDAGQSYDEDGQLAGYRWEFDDLGSPLDAPTVERAYVTPGVWSAQLIVTDDSGVANGTAQDDVTIRVNNAPQAEAGPTVESERLYVVFDGTGSSDADGDALIYRWDFGDNSSPGFGAQVTHVYADPGVYPVTLQVDDGTGLANARSIDATTVTIRARPVADAGGNRDVCSGEPVLFDASDSADPDGGLLLYSWEFGDGSTSDLINPTKTYERPGVYPVTLQVRNETGTEYGTSMDRIAALVREGPIADAGADMQVCANAKVRFDGTGSSDADGAVNAFSWTFGDGGTGSGDTPEHIFTRPGSYTVTLTITGEARGACSPLDTDTTLVEVVPAPELRIRGPERAAVGAAVTLKAHVGAAGGETPKNFRWTFGDGSTAEGAEISHVWAEPGRYSVTLRADLRDGSAGCGALEMVQWVVVNAAPAPLIDGPDMLAVGQEARFDASLSADSDGAILSYEWAFGDGGTASGVRTAHSFDAPGTYDLRLTVRDDAGVSNSSVTALKQVVVRPVPVANLNAPPPVCPAEPVIWQVDAEPQTQVRWVFGDGRAAEGAEVRHMFDRPGLFPVQVSLDDGAGLLSSRSSEEVYARVNAAPSALAGPDRVVCPGEPVMFDAGPSTDLDGRLVGYQWVFSDGVTLDGAQVERSFDSPGALEVRLTVRDDSGAAACDTGSDTARVLVNAPPMVDAGPDRTVPVGAAHDVVRFDASDTRDPDGQGVRVGWQFGDGAGASGAVARHGYGAPGDYTVTVEARDTTGLVCGVARDTAVITARPRGE
ncbi:PKD domain-containing protein [Antarcticimicrobium sediminis]|uniref:PKD domain-containing protein n=1 Tax=Antarcticimicrobium sediminis TaxID=2546227 RepID=A0A4V2Z854_9RHOB|nr:PKD domain-containing protein [Antarcticimicrobium sediminis]TDE39086.1 PKD domain-containing protein [Antarcticimicrobium sediminis]